MKTKTIYSEDFKVIETDLGKLNIAKGYGVILSNNGKQVYLSIPKEFYDELLAWEKCLI